MWYFNIFKYAVVLFSPERGLLYQKCDTHKLPQGGEGRCLTAYALYVVNSCFINFNSPLKYPNKKNAHATHVTTM